MSEQTEQAEPDKFVLDLGDVVLFWIAAEDGELIPRPGIVNAILSEGHANLTLFPGNGINDVKGVQFSDTPTANSFTMRG